MLLGKSKHWGGALGSTLLVVLLLVVFGLTLVNLATFDLRTVSRNGQRQLAFNAAEAGLEAVIAELSRDPRIGASDEVFAETLADGSSYRVSFDPGDSGPWSSNNIANLVGVTGYLGHQAPPFHALIFAQGTSPTGETSLVECLIKLEATPYAVAGSNKVALTSAVVSGVTGPASVYSGSSANDSIRLRGVSNVSGDARTPGKIIVDLLANLQGEKDEDHSPESLPALRIEDFRNDTTPGVTLHGPVASLPLVLSGSHYFNGSVNSLSMVLLDANVFVDGDLTTLALAGTGTIFVTGETRLVAGLNLTGNNRVTLFSQGDITISVLGLFQGVLYSHGNINAPLGVSVLGAVYAVAEPGNTSKGRVTLGGLVPSIVVHSPEMTRFATSFLALGGGADAVRVYWSKLY